MVLRSAEGDYDVGDLGWQQAIEPENLDMIRRQLAQERGTVRRYSLRRHGVWRVRHRRRRP
ncbi:MAG: hypothetical protein ACRDLN_05715 [Solirubrobacteraceae bacterium]